MKLSLTATTYTFSRWGFFRGNKRIGINLGRLALRFNYYQH